MSASVATPFRPSCKLNGAFLEAHPEARAGGLLSREAVQIQGLDRAWTGAHPVSEGRGATLQGKFSQVSASQVTIRACGLRRQRTFIS